MAFLMRRLPKKPFSEILLLGQARTAADPPTAIARSAPAMATSGLQKLSVATSTWFTAPGSTTRRYAATSGGQAAEEVTLGNEEYLEPGQVAKRFAVGTTALTPEELSVVRNEEDDVIDGKTKAKQVLQSVGEKLKDVQDGREERELHEKLVSTQGIGDVVQDMYNQKEAGTVL